MFTISIIIFLVKKVNYFPLWESFGSQWHFEIFLMKMFVFLCELNSKETIWGIPNEICNTSNSTPFCLLPTPTLFPTPRTENICAGSVSVNANRSSRIALVPIEHCFHIPVLGRINCNITSKRLRLESGKIDLHQTSILFRLSCLKIKLNLKGKKTYIGTLGNFSSGLHLSS